MNILTLYFLLLSVFSTPRDYFNNFHQEKLNSGKSKEDLSRNVVNGFDRRLIELANLERMLLKDGTLDKMYQVIIRLFS